MKKVILILTVILAFVACQNDDIKPIDGQDEIRIKIGERVSIAEYTQSEIDFFEQLHESNQRSLLLKAYNGTPIPDDLEYMGHYWVPYDFGYPRQGTMYIVYSSAEGSEYDPEGSVWGVVVSGMTPQMTGGSSSNFHRVSYGSGFPWLMWYNGAGPVNEL